MSITPDTKNWTWVLDRACPECGFDASASPRPDVGALLRENVAAWHSLIGRPGTHTARPDPSTWSPLEYACHVRDAIKVYDLRLGLMLDQDGPAYPDWNQDETAVASRYHEQDPAAVATDILGLGERLAARFDAVTGQQWDRTGFRSDGSVFTVDTFARYFIHDPIHHYWDVTRNGPTPA
ncbi:MAG: DinB family protein [Streptosporangiaceae bacterium]